MHTHTHTHKKTNKQTHTGTERDVVDGARVTLDLLQYPIASGVPDAHRAVFTPRHQQGARRVQSHGVHLKTKQIGARCNVNQWNDDPVLFGSARQFLH